MALGPASTGEAPGHLLRGHASTQLSHLQEAAALGPLEVSESKHMHTVFCHAYFISLDFWSKYFVVSWTKYLIIIPFISCCQFLPHVSSGPNSLCLSGHCCQQPQGKELLPPVSLQDRIGPHFLQLTAAKVHAPVSLWTPPLTAQDKVVGVPCQAEGGALGAKSGMYLWNIQSHCICQKDRKLRMWMKWFESWFVATLEPNGGKSGLSN